MKVSGDGKFRSLVKFDLTRIPEGAEIFSASLSVHCREVKQPSGNAGLQLLRAAEFWEEGNRKIAKPEIGATWYEPVYRNGSRKEGNWKTPGGTADTESDFGTGPNGVIAEQPVPENGRIEFDVTPIVRMWVEREVPNYGFLLRIMPEGKAGDDYGVFYSSDYTGNYSFRPSLSVHFRGRSGKLDSGYELLHFDGFPGEEKSLVSGEEGDFKLTDLLIRDSAPDRAEKNADWRGKVGNFKGAFHRVLFSTGKLFSLFPAGARITKAELRLHIKESDGGRIDFWHIRNRWDADSVNWNYASDEKPWGAAGCSSSSDRDPDRAVTCDVPEGRDFWIDVDLSKSLEAILNGTQEDTGFLMTASDEFSSSFRFSAEDEGEDKTAPVLQVTYFIPDLTDFKPLFSPDERSTWKSYGRGKPSFREDEIIIPPGSGITGETGISSGFGLNGDLRRLKGMGWFEISMEHRIFGTYRIQIGNTYRILFDRGKERTSDVLWEKDPGNVSEWTELTVSLNGETLYLQAGDVCSGPVQIENADPGVLRFKAVSCYTEFRNAVVGTAR